jgi:hypothetical protein
MSYALGVLFQLGMFMTTEINIQMYTYLPTRIFNIYILIIMYKNIYIYIYVYV